MRSASRIAGCCGLVGLLAACQPGLAPTAAPTSIPTAFPTANATLLPTATPTSTPVAIWRILFSGFPCEGRAMCVPFDDTRSSYYAINSDGTGLEQVQIFPTVIPPPEGSPPHYLVPSPQLSPDGSLLAYVAGNGLYLSDMKSGETRLVFQTESIPSAAPKLGPFCWTPDGLMIRFNVKRQEDEEWLDAFYMINLNDNSVQPLFTVAGLGGLMFSGDCSPDRQELAFSIPESSAEGKAGLYVMSLATGEWRQVLSNYYVWEVRAAPVEVSP